MTKLSSSNAGSRIVSTIPRFLAIGLAGAALSSPAAGAAESGHPFAEFAGKWQGAGEVVGKDDARERIRCRASYDVTQNDAALAQNLVCASTNYRIVVNSYVVAESDKVQGYWNETTRQVQGNITGHIAGGVFEGAVTGATFGAKLLLKVADGKQSIDIRPEGADIAEVRVTLTR